MPALNLSYVLPRLVRHFMPEQLTRFLLLRSMVIRPGLETSDPAAAVDRYVRVLNQRGGSLRGKRVMLFGYGGRFDVGLGLLEAGAAHVLLCERDAPPDDNHNAQLLSQFGQYLQLQDGHPRPRAQFMTLLQADVRALRPSVEAPACDYVFSNSVYEHVDDVDGITCALVRFAQPDGLHVHYVDLRDHFFKYPFEMLTYSEKTWYGWLNPTSNHNRFRLWNYREVFGKYFEEIRIDILARDEAAFQQAQQRIRPEFLSGSVEDDSVTLIRVVAGRPRPQ
jgi:hypothetical protein